MQRLVLRAKLPYGPVFLRVVEDSKVSPWNKPAFREICNAIQHASVYFFMRKLSFLFWLHALLIQRGKTCVATVSSQRLVSYFDFNPLWKKSGMLVRQGFALLETVPAEFNDAQRSKSDDVFAVRVKTQEAAQRFFFTART